MIRIRYHTDGGQHCLRISGHAGYAPRGSDIVCAAVSAIACTLLEYLRQTGTAVEVRAGSGALCLRCPTGGSADGAIAMALTGLHKTAETYPRYAVVDTAPSGAWQAGTDRGKGA